MKFDIKKNIKYLGYGLLTIIYIFIPCGIIYLILLNLSEIFDKNISPSILFLFWTIIFLIYSLSNFILIRFIRKHVTTNRLFMLICCLIPIIIFSIHYLNIDFIYTECINRFPNITNTCLVDANIAKFIDVYIITSFLLTFFISRLYHYIIFDD